MYRKAVWETSIYVVERETGRFHVAIAIEFWDHVVAFLSLDNVFQPEWAFGVGYLPATQEFQFLDPPPSIFANFTTFLECVAHWVEEQSSSTHSGLACKAVHGANRVWLGVGVYTVAELFFMAGMMSYLLPFVKASLHPQKHNVWHSRIGFTFMETFIGPALEGPLAGKVCNMGALVFGSQTWAALGGAVNGNLDPLTQYFASFIRQ
ncbi:hypothetical protein L208DRAFT_1374439 [Tricholoma matsutake]|nr:hypothetical protein L208DRAFT_1374439 [Tricholoma matsutake 945]